MYIYIYIYCNRQTDCFVISQLFSVATTTRCFKQGSKPSWLYVHQTSYPRAIIILCINEEIFYVYLSTYMLLATWNAQFLRRALAIQIMWQPADFPTRVLNP